MALGARAPEWAVERLREEMHLNEPLYVQYYYWAKGALHGDFGMSLVTRRSVANDIKEFLPASLELALYAGIFMGIIGITQPISKLILVKIGAIQLGRISLNSICVLLAPVTSAA
ncbi:unnamed protein product [marine sediment metagenome]|uniref:ABC transmembrane type-1 domain-containing protein n=1 Tax=marine sediment metagenome TaxID=412755 RepID=X1NJY1_9ZZZZ